MRFYICEGHIFACSCSEGLLSKVTHLVTQSRRASESFRGMFLSVSNCNKAKQRLTRSRTICNEESVNNSVGAEG